MVGHTPQTLPILMYHSISEGSGPTHIAPHIFDMQMTLIRACGWTALPAEKVRAWIADGDPLPPKSLVITFDDGFKDFCDTAYPILEREHLPSLVFLPSALVGQTPDWENGAGWAHPLMSWQEARDLDGTLVRFGSHSRTHVDLTTLDPQALRDEVKGAKEELEAQLNRPVPEFAAPYGRINPGVLSEIKQTYDIAFGVRLALAKADSPLFDLPRIEMFYYQDEKIWRNFLMGQGRTYLTLRQSLRGVKSFASHLMRR